MNPISDEVLAHLRSVTDLPDLSGTRYELEERLGRGGMGVVYAARDRVLGRRVAIKVASMAAAGPEDAQRLLEEARTIARLEHPGIVPLYDAGELPDGRLYYAMKLVEGERLDVYAAGGTPLADRLRVFQKICEAAGYAHSRGVVHRDLKPSNIMIGAFGEVLVLDWAAGGVAGTPEYMAPEQIGRGDVDPRADVHALGAILRDLIGAAPARPLAAIMAKAMDANPGERYQSAGELIADVDRYLDREAVAAHRETLIERADRFVGRNKVLLGLFAAYVVVRFAVYVLGRY